MKVAIVSALVIAGLHLSPVVVASAWSPLPAVQEGHGIGDPKIEYRLRIARADAQQEKMHNAADEIGRLSIELADRVSRGASLEEDDAKTLDRIRKLAKRLRSDLGGAGVANPTEMPSNVRDAVEALGSNGAEFARLFSRSSRFVVDARIVRMAGEIVVLAEFLKQHAR